MKRQLLGVAAILLSISTYAQDNPLWMRYCAISPDGTTIAFTYKGDIYTVPSTGGRASQITTNPAHDTKPIWSPDGKKLLSHQTEWEVWIFWGKQGRGYPQRLTTHSGNETPVAYKDAGHILFLANIMPTAEDAQFPSGQFQQVYEVNTEGGRPILFSSMPMEDISINHTGNTLLYHDKKDMKTLGVNITLHPLPAIFGCVLWMETVPFANKLLSMVRTALPFGLQMINHSII